MLPALLVILAYVCAGTLGAHHPEVEGEHPEQEDIDNGQCIPIKCDLGVPPEQCSRLCALRRYETICKPPGDFCLCQRLVGGTVQLVSPDEVEDQPPAEEDRHFTLFAIFIPLKNFFFDDGSSREVEPPLPTADNYASEGYQVVNVHEGRLFWDFRYILTGLFFLMVGLVVYELIMCRIQSYSKSDPDDPKAKILNI